MTWPVAAAAAAAAIAAATVRLGGYQGASSILTQALTHFLQGVAQGPAGLACHVQADVTASGETARSLFDSVESGGRKVCYLASGYLAARVPELALLDLPFSVHDRAAALHALDGDVSRALSHALSRAVARETGLRVLAFRDNGFRHLSNGRRPLRNPDDCRGLVVRTLDSADYRAAMHALGFCAITTDVRELRDAVVTGRVDAQENPLTNFVHFELWRHHRHVSLTAHLFGVALLVCNRRWFDALTAPAQQCVSQAAGRAALVQRQRAEQDDVEALAFLRREGIVVRVASAIDLPAMVACCTPLVAAWRAALPAGLVAAYLQTP